jgi:hypothetical protein
VVEKLWGVKKYGQIKGWTGSRFAGHLTFPLLSGIDPHYNQSV